MRKLLRVNPGLLAFPCFIALLIAGVLLGGFFSTQVNGSVI